MLTVLGRMLGAVILLNMCVEGCSVKISILLFAVSENRIFSIGDFCLGQEFYYCIVCDLCIQNYILLVYQSVSYQLSASVSRSCARIKSI